MFGRGCDTLNVGKGETLNFNAIDGKTGITVLNTVNSGMTEVYGAINSNEGIAKVYARDCKKIEVPGFRKGKAPQKMIEKMYGESVFFESAVELLYPEAANEAINESGLVLVAQPKLDITTVSKDDIV